MTFIKWATPLILLLFAACTPFGGFKPPPAGWTYYAGSGATQLEIEAAYLECGFPYPGDFWEMPKELQEKLGFFNNTDKQYAALAERYHCMKNAGFPIKLIEDPCVVGYGRSSWPACELHAKIPKRSMANRINNPYCKIYPQVKICQSNYAPSAVEDKSNPEPKALSVAPAPSWDPATRLQEQVQRASNTQMNQMLQGGGSQK